MQFNFPSLVYKNTVQGIESSVVNEHSGGNYVVNLKYTFYIKRQGILKRWDAIYSNFPNLGDMKTEVKFYRYIKRDRTKIIDPTNYKGYIAEGEPGFRLSPLVASPFKKNKRSGKNVVNEYIHVTITKPLIFVTDIREEMTRVMKLRSFIYAENTRLASVDRINGIMGQPVLPEYNPEDLDELLNREKRVHGQMVGDGLRRHGDSHYGLSV